jgi:hypothetical protein
MVIYLPEPVSGTIKLYIECAIAEYLGMILSVCVPLKHFLPNFDMRLPDKDSIEFKELTVECPKLSRPKICS